MSELIVNQKHSNGFHKDVEPFYTVLNWGQATGQKLISGHSLSFIHSSLCQNSALCSWKVARVRDTTAPLQEYIVGFRKFGLGIKALSVWIIIYAYFQYHQQKEVCVLQLSV